MVMILPQKNSVGKNVSGPPPPPRAGAMLSETFCQDCGSVVSITYLVWCDMVMVVVLLGVRCEVTVHVVG